jgi:hypothetical protein
MRSHLEFRSSSLFDSSVDGAMPKGRTVAMLLAKELPRHGYEVEHVHSEDWDWRVQVANASFPLWIGCGHYEEYMDGHLCFVEPSRPYIRCWLKRVPTTNVAERLAAAIEDIIRGSGEASHIRWWT